MNSTYRKLFTILFVTVTHTLFAFNSSPPEDSSQTNTTINDGKVQLTLGLFLPNINSSVQINTPSGGIGTNVNLEAAFKLPESQQLFRGNGIYRFNNNHSVEGYYYALNRSGQNVSKDSIPHLMQDLKVTKEAVLNETEYQSKIKEGMDLINS